MNNHKIRLTLGSKILLLTLAMCAVICAVSLIGDYISGGKQIKSELASIGYTLSEVAADHVWGASEPETLMQELVDSSKAVRMTVVRLGDEESVTSVADFGADDLGLPEKTADLPEKVRSQLEFIREGGEAQPVKSQGKDGGKYLTTIYPITNADSSLAGCILCDFRTDTMEPELNIAVLKSAALLLAVVLVVMLVYMSVIRRTVITPIRRLTDAVQAYEVGENKSSLRSLELKGNDELKSLSDSFRMMLVEIDLRSFEERELAVREERVEAELKLTTAVNQAMLPKSLAKSGEEVGFDIRGLSEQAGELSCDFYDYFLLEDGKLCFVVGSVPSQGVSAALFMVIAKTTIKSQMRVGLPILEAMTEANRQLYDVGQGMVVNALVGVLDEKGVLSFVNAGQEPPLLMRFEDRFECQNGPVYAPLGQNENVSYQMQQIQLFQGDRLFFHTAGLSDIVGEGGQKFGKQRLQASLNVSRGKCLSAEELLDYMRTEGKAYAARARDVSGFSMLSMDYLRSRKDLSHCVVDRDRAGAMKIAEFLKRQLGENSFSKKDSAQVVVLADEIFALCCRQRTQGLVTVECAVEEDGTVILRFKSAFGGRDPLTMRGGADMENALAFVHKNARELSFQPGELQDVLTVVVDPSANDRE